MSHSNGGYAMKAGYPWKSASFGDPLKIGAMVRLSRTHSSWLAVLSFRPERQFRPADVRLLALFRKVLLNQRQHSAERDQWQATLLGLIHCLVTAIDARDANTAGRSER